MIFGTAHPGFSGRIPPANRETVLGPNDRLFTAAVKHFLLVFSKMAASMLNAKDRNFVAEVIFFCAGTSVKEMIEGEICFPS